MGKIALVRAIAFICSIAAKIIAVPFVLLGRLLRRAAALFSRNRQRRKERRLQRRMRREERRLRRKESQEHRKERKDEKRRLRLERRRLREELRERRPRRVRKIKDYTPVINKLRGKYRNTRVAWILRAIYAVGILGTKVYWKLLIIFQKVYWGLHSIYRRIYWISRGLFQRGYWFFRVWLERLYWFFRGLFQKAYWFFRVLFQKAYWFFRGLFQKAYWFFRVLFQKAYWYLRGLLQKGYWHFYYPKSRKLYQFLCRNAYMDLFFVFLRGYMNQSVERISCVRILGVEEYVRRHKAQSYYQVIEDGKERVVCIPAYFERNGEEIERFDSPEIYLARIQNVSLIGGSNVILADKILLNDAAYQDKEHRIDIRYSSIKNVLDGIAVIEDQDVAEEIGKGINLVSAASFNYYHLVVEILSRLAFVDTCEDYWGYPILVDEVVLRIPQFQSAMECINHLGHPVIKIEKGKKYLVKDLILPSPNVWMPANVYNRNLIRVSDFMISDTVLLNIRKAVGIWQERPAWRNIFISRKKAQAIRLKNEREVREMFAQNGFEIVYAEEMSFREQVECFGQAKCVIATSGAALTNTIFCQPGTLIGCIIPSEHKFFMYSTIAYMLGLRMLFLDAEIIESTPYPAADTFILDKDYVSRYIETINNKYK